MKITFARGHQGRHPEGWDISQTVDATTCNGQKPFVPKGWMHWDRQLGTDANMNYDPNEREVALGFASSELLWSKEKMC